MPFLKDEKRAAADIRAYISFIQAAQFYYRNYQDESLYAKAVRYIATGVKPAAWDAETKEAIAHYDRYGGRELIGKSPVMTTLQERINRVAKCDVRLVMATNRDLPKLVAEGKFREDLYQRLNVVQLRTPSLREHKEDIPLIANSWWRKFHDNRVLDEEQLAALMDYDYPGNVRELVNLLDRATALGEDDFAALMREHKEMNAGLLGGLELRSGRIPDRLEDATKLHVRRVFEKYGQNLSRAAEALGISRNTVRKYL